jgi:hypothetical protein
MAVKSSQVRFQAIGQPYWRQLKLTLGQVVQAQRCGFSLGLHQNLYALVVQNLTSHEEVSGSRINHRTVLGRCGCAQGTLGNLDSLVPEPF